VELDAFRHLVDRLAAEIPAEYLAGIAAIDVSRRAVPHPVHADVYTLGECVPIHSTSGEIVSRVVLYHGSFTALAQLDAGFDWGAEARETLLHEVRHHLEWQADAEDLESFDWAVEQNFRRHNGDPFDPLFFQVGERVADGVFRVDDDVFIERVVTSLPASITVPWHGRRYTVTVPHAALPVFLALDGLQDPPDGDVVVVFRRKPQLMDLFRSGRPPTEVRAYVDVAD
jgi:hypothetical protein